MFLSRITGALSSTLVFIISLLSVFFILTPVPVHAQEVGFSKCQFNASSSSGDGSIQTCLGQIFQFTFVVGMFIIAIRVALFALGNYNPFDNGKAVNDSIKIVWESVLGFILLGSPVLIINVINPAALNLSFLQIGGLVQQGGPAPNTGTKTNTTTTDTSKPKITTNKGTTTSSDKLKDANQAIRKAGYLPTPTASIGWFNPFYTPQVQAQSELSVDEAIQVISDVLAVEEECKKLFITELDFNNCKQLEEPEFVTERNNIDTRTRELYTPLTEIQRTYIGKQVLSRQVTVLDSQLASNTTDNSACRVEYAIIQENQSKKTHLLSTEYCGNLDFDSLIWDKNGQVLTPRAGQVLEAGAVAVTNGTINILN
jgi:hypothetical protein